MVAQASNPNPNMCGIKDLYGNFETDFLVLWLWENALDENVGEPEGLALLLSPHI